MPRNETRAAAAVACVLTGAGVVGYTYAGYPVLMSAVARTRRAPAGRRPRPQVADSALPHVTVIIPAFDEAAVIAAKIADTRNQDYPSDKLEIIVVADGSTDDTPVIAERHGVRVLFDSERRGKGSAVNRGVAAATNELVVLTDANCALKAGTLRAIVDHLAEPGVGVVSGAKTVTGAGARGAGEGMYWRLESYLKRSESVIGSTMGSPGEITGLRRSHYRPIPDDVINDDFHLACDALRRGLDVGYAPDACAQEQVSASVSDEWERRTRIAAGSWQTVIQYLGLANPRLGWRAVAFTSHRLLRGVVVPVLLPALWLSSVVLSRRNRLIRIFAAGQTLWYTAALLGAGSDCRAFAVPFQFGFTNAASLRGGWRYLSGGQSVAWQRLSRQPWSPVDREKSQ